MLAVSDYRVPAAQQHSKQLQISRYEQVASWLWALAICLAVLCLVLMVVLFRPFNSFQTHLVPVTWDEESGEDLQPEGAAEDYREPGVQDLADVHEPQLADSIAAISTAVSTVQALHEQYEGNAAEMGTGFGPGDRREKGLNTGSQADRPHERWQIRYSSVSRELYAKQLNFFGIELGAVSRATPTIRYVTELTADRPTRREGRKSLEERIFFSHRNDQMREWDKSLLVDAGESDDELESEFILVHFYPGAIREQLLEIEKAEIGDQAVGDIKRTTFGVKQTERGFEYYIIEIQMKSSR